MRSEKELEISMSRKVKTHPKTTIASKTFQYPPSKKRLVPISLSLQQKSKRITKLRMHSMKRKRGDSPMLKPKNRVTKTNTTDTIISAM